MTMKMLIPIAAALRLSPSPEVAAQAAFRMTATKPYGSQMQRPSAMPSQRLLAPRITLPLVDPQSLTVDPPALEGGKPAPLGGYDDAARRCESLGDVRQRAQCRDRVARETPVRPVTPTP